MLVSSNDLSHSLRRSAAQSVQILSAYSVYAGEGEQNELFAWQSGDRHLSRLRGVTGRLIELMPEEVLGFGQPYVEVLFVRPVDVPLVFGERNPLTLDAECVAPPRITSDVALELGHAPNSRVVKLLREEFDYGGIARVGIFQLRGRTHLLVKETVVNRAPVSTAYPGPHFLLQAMGSRRATLISTHSVGHLFEELVRESRNLGRMTLSLRLLASVEEASPPEVFETVWDQWSAEAARIG